MSNTASPRSVRQRLVRHCTLFGVTGVAMALLAAVPAPNAWAQESELSVQEAERLHYRMLELRQFERQGDRAYAIRLAEELLRDFPRNPRVEEALLHLYRVERQDTKLVELLSNRITRNPREVELSEVRELGTHLLAMKRQSEALAMLQRVIAANPKDEMRYRVAAVLMRSHRHIDLAIQLYRQGREAIGRESLFAAELAQLEEARGDYGAAIGEYLLLVMDPDRRSRARRKVIRLLERAGDAEVVLERVDQLRRRHPKNPAVQDIAATAYLHSGRLDDAWQAVRAADRYADDQGEHLLEFGRLALQTERGAPVDLERMRLGVRVLQRLPKEHPESNLIPQTARLLAEGLVTVARQVDEEPTRTELLQEAVSSLDMTLNEERFAALQRDAMALKGMILFEDLKQPEAALEAFETLVTHQQEQKQSDHMVRVQMGLCLAALDRFDEARAVLQEVADSGDEQPPELQMPGRQQRRHKTPAPETIGSSRARYHLAELDLVEGEYDRAIDAFAALAEEAPDDRLANDCLDLALLLNEASLDAPDVRAQYGEYRRALLRKDGDAAQTHLEALVEQHPESSLHPIALYELAQVFDAAGKFEVALQRFQSLVEAHAEHRLAARALEAMGDLYLEDLGQPELAVAQFERILIDYPNDLFLDDVRKKLLTARDAQKEDDDATP